jgi:nucleoside-diphosphate-sugar epimerase
VSARGVLVTGASGVVGPCLLRRLAAAGFDVVAVSRRPPREAAQGVCWRALDLGLPDSLEGPVPPALVHAAPLWLLPPLLPRLAARGLRRLVAFSSTSRFSKQRSRSAAERELAARLARAEQALECSAAALGVEWTILRPTLVYGGGRDRNVSEIARLARRFGVVPIAGRGGGRRQPVHADDLAAACVTLLERDRAGGRAYDVAGGETLTYREMALRVAGAVTPAPRVLRLPVPLARAALSLASRFRRFGHLSPEAARRMDEDLVFDDSAARAAFGWSPRAFRYDGESGP